MKWAKSSVISIGRLDRRKVSNMTSTKSRTLVIEQRDWASLYFKESVPDDPDRFNAYKIKITFEVGYTIDTDITTDVPAALIMALKMVVAAYYTNRGDCSDCGCDLNGYPVPCGAKAIIDSFSIAKTVLGGSYTPANSDSNCGFC